MNKILLIAVSLAIMAIPLDSNSQTCSPTSPICVPANGYAFQYSADTDYGLKFNAVSGEYQFTDMAGVGLFNINAVSGLVTVKNNLLVEKKLGVGAGNPLAVDFSVSNGLSHFGVASGYAEFDNDGDLRFTGTADYLVPGNRYAFRYSASPGYGLFFNSTASQYEFRTANASPVLSIQANTGDVEIDGTAKIGNVANDNALTEVLVKDNDGLVHYRDASTLGGGGGLWTASGSDISNANTGNVGFGGLPTSIPATKKGIEIIGDNPQLILNDNAGGAIDNFSIVNSGGDTWFENSTTNKVLMNFNLTSGNITVDRLSFGSPYAGKHLAIWESPTGFYGIGNGPGQLEFFAGGNTADAKMIISDNGTVELGRLSFGSPATGKHLAIWESPTAFYGIGNAQGQLQFFAGGNTSDAIMVIVDNGKVGIGTTTPQSELAVNGTITCKEVDVTLAGFPDYVFHDDYKLMPLNEVSAFIDRNGRLPKMPSEAEVIENGIGLGALNVKLVEKIEELTLHTINQQELIEKQMEIIKTIQEQIVELEKANQ